MEICTNCGVSCDTEIDAHHDEATGFVFCGAPCESNYDKNIGLPPEYILPEPFTKNN